MATTLTCVLPAYDWLRDKYVTGGTQKPEVIEDCLRVDTSGNRETKLVIRVDGDSSRDGSLRSARASVATMSTLSARGSKLLKEETVFVKWAIDKHRMDALRREVGFYTHELIHLQGKVVPRLVGYYELSNNYKDFAITVFEHCYGGLPLDTVEYHRQFMIAACAIHSAGIVHGQLALSYNLNSPLFDRHVFFDSNCRVRIVDFTRAKRHKCAGAPLRVPGLKPMDKCCEELEFLETVIGDKLTGMSAREAERRREEELAMMRYRGRHHA